MTSSTTPIDDDARLGRPSLEVTVGPEYDRVPPRVLRTLSDCDFGIHDVSVRGEPTHFSIVAC